MKKILLLLTAGSVFMTGCAVLMSGTKQNVGISSVPSGAIVTVDGQEKGKAPVMVALKRKTTHLIKIEMEGYEPFEIYTKKKLNNWLWGNVLFGGLIGLGIDMGTGAIYKISPSRITGNLVQKSAELENGDAIVIEATLTPLRDWEKIGSLKKIVIEQETRAL